jgi:hypothetical protein
MKGFAKVAGAGIHGHISVIHHRNGLLIQGDYSDELFLAMHEAAEVLGFDMSFDEGPVLKEFDAEFGFVINEEVLDKWEREVETMWAKLKQIS